MIPVYNGRKCVLLMEQRTEDLLFMVTFFFFLFCFFFFFFFSFLFFSFSDLVFSSLFSFLLLRRCPCVWFCFVCCGVCFGLCFVCACASVVLLTLPWPSARPANPITLGVSHTHAATQTKKRRHSERARALSLHGKNNLLWKLLIRQQENKRSIVITSIIPDYFYVPLLVTTCAKGCVLTRSPQADYIALAHAAV